jgi:hypothetical protein
MAQSIDLSKATRQTVDPQKTKPFPTPQTRSPRSGGGGMELFGVFCYLYPDAQPGENIATITGLPANTWVVSASPTEVGADGTPHVGDAVFYNQSVELDTDNQLCQVTYYLDWSNPLPDGVMVIIGFFPE